MLIEKLFPNKLYPSTESKICGALCYSAAIGSAIYAVQTQSIYFGVASIGYLLCGRNIFPRASQIATFGSITTLSIYGFHLLFPEVTVSSTIAFMKSVSSTVQETYISMKPFLSECYKYSMILAKEIGKVSFHITKGFFKVSKIAFQALNYIVFVLEEVMEKGLLSLLDLIL